jgi:aerobic carbon-monoxide dehydrogenase medium subunit
VKPSPFTLHRPETLDDALAALAETRGKVLAGGQSLLPILSMRLAAPPHLVDINRLPDLAHVTSSPDGVRVGALARHRAVERDDGAASVQPLLRQALGYVAHPTIRNRGTSVGSLAHADPSGELTAVLALTGGSVRLASAQGSRTVLAEEFFLGPLESAVRPGELAVEAFFPAFPPGTGTAFAEISRRHGDYGVCGVAAAYPPEGSGVPARVGYLAMGPVPVVRELPPPDGDPTLPQSWRRAAAEAVGGLDPEDDLHATADYRAHLARVLTARALAEAAGRSREAA